MVIHPGLKKIEPPKSIDPEASQRKKVEKFTITLKNNGPLDSEKTKAVQSHIPFTITLVDREKKDEDLEPGDDLPEMMYEHTYQLFFASQEDYDCALNILRCLQGQT